MELYMQILQVLGGSYFLVGGIALLAGTGIAFLAVNAILKRKNKGLIKKLGKQKQE